MRTEYLALDGGPSDQPKIAHAARLLEAGNIVAFPTDTVYGLAADSRNPEALAKLTKIKGRAEGRGYSLLIPSIRQARELSGGLSRVADKLARVYWPGPLTLVVPRRAGGTLGFRLPDHPVARTLLSHCKFPVAAPSANRAGTAEPVSAEQVRETLGGQISLILDNGPTRQRRPSTIVRVDDDTLEIQREGVIPSSEILRMASPTMLFVCTGNTCRSPMAAGFCHLAAMETVRPDTLPLRVLSSGTDAKTGDGAHPLSVQAMREIGIDISRHKTSLLSPSMLDSADWVFTMTRAQRDSILEFVPDATERIQLLSNLGEDIPEPGGRSIERYRMVRDKIHGCLREILKFVKGSGV